MKIIIISKAEKCTYVIYSKTNITDDTNSENPCKYNHDATVTNNSGLKQPRNYLLIIPTEQNG